MRRALAVLDFVQFLLVKLYPRITFKFQSLWFEVKVKSSGRSVIANKFHPSVEEKENFRSKSGGFCFAMFVQTSKR